MELRSEQIELLMMHEWLWGSKALVASERIDLAWGEDTAGKITVLTSEEKQCYDIVNFHLRRLSGKQNLSGTRTRTSPLPEDECYLCTISTILIQSKDSMFDREIRLQGTYVG
ncbi:hypothetical protein KIN20_028969 [Parelaphostrongylus tenuis]|uniref:Uncharacterized protein n=1 Tax=Parelaphostrongylus tenuis TaxID=148309 RepID=A0AAD5WF49_PARTN|nr:hypothetical protein KIN20_028969 [Parelaphostrongylus tenuis]